MIMRGQNIYSSHEETTSFPSSSGIEDEVRGEESSEEDYPTTKKTFFYVAHSKVVPWNRCRMYIGDIFVINGNITTMVFHTRLCT